MPDDPRNDDTPSDFDDWLSEDSGPPTDPYAALTEEPQTEDLDEWQAFAAASEESVAELVEPNEPAEAEDDSISLMSVDDTPSDDDASEDDPLFRTDIDEPDPADEVIVQDAIVVNAPNDDLAYLTDDMAHTPDLVVEDLEEDPDVGGDTDEILGLIPEAPDEIGAEGDDVGFVLDDVEPITTVSAPDDAASGAGDVASPVVEFEAFDGGGEPDTAEVEIIAPEPFELPGSDDAASEGDEDDSAWIASETDDEANMGSDSDGGGSVPFEFPEAPDESEFDPFDDTGEAVFVAGAGALGAGAASSAPSFADLWGDAPVAGAAAGNEDATQSGPDDESQADEFGLDEGALLHGTTREHTGLAAAIAAAETQETEQVALVAEIPGLESSVVGFEDVVEAEGYRKVRARASGDLIARVVTGVVLVLALAASLVWRPALLALAVTVFVLGAGEFYTALVRSGRKPISLFGFVGIVGASLGAYFWSAAAIPIAFLLATVMLLLFYAVVPGKSDPLGNLALTTTVMVWAGLGSFALLIARSEDYQVLVLGVVLAVAAADIGAFFVGREIGRTHLAPWVSPKKTVEGLVAGSIVAIGVGAGLSYFDPFELTSGLAIGAAAAAFTPLGDLAMSAAKRSLGLKDMGSVLPGHGGFLDRIDGLLFTVPAAWVILTWAALL